MKDELGRKVMPKFVGLTEKSYSYLIDDGRKNKIDTDNITENHKEFIKKQKINIKNTAKV